MNRVAKVLEMPEIRVYEARPCYLAACFALCRPLDPAYGWKAEIRLRRPTDTIAQAQTSCCLRYVCRRIAQAQSSKHCPLSQPRSPASSLPAWHAISYDVQPVWLGEAAFFCRSDEFESWLLQGSIVAGLCNIPSASYWREIALGFSGSGSKGCS